MNQSTSTPNSAQGLLPGAPRTLIEELTEGESPFLLPEDVERVVHCKRDRYDVLIDRRSEWGNPFPLADFDGDRRACLVVYAKNLRVWLMRKGVIAHEQLDGLYGKTLGCWCSPKACHGHILAAVASMVAGDGYDRADRESWLDALIERFATGDDQ